MRKDPNSLESVEYVTGADVLFRWMGTLWSQLSDDADLIRRYQEAKGLLAAQSTVLYQETASVLDRNNVPVFHRERWKPVVLRQADQNTGKGSAIRLDSDYTPVIGKQTEAPFVIGSKIEIGGYLPLNGVTTYPLPEGVDQISNVIVDDPAEPSTVLINGIDFYVENNTLFFIHDTDPLSAGFPIVDGSEGSQTLVWIADALVDKKYIQNFIGYVLGADGESSEFYKRYLNAIWDTYNAGATFTNFRSALAAIFDEPSIIEETEVVTDIITVGDKRQVATDQHVYEITANAELRTSVVVGATLRRGELITQTIKVYDNLDPTRLSGASEYGGIIRTDIPAFTLQPSFFRAKLRYGLGISWERQNVTAAGVDANGNAKLRFDLFGIQSDIDAFWEDFWDWCETNNVAPIDYFDGLSTPTGVLGNYGSVIPFEFFLANFLKTNTLFITVDSGKLSTLGLTSMRNVELLRDVLPKHVYVSILERNTVGPEEYEEYDEALEVADAVPLSEVASPGPSHLARLSYEDRVVTRWISVCG